MPNIAALLKEEISRLSRKEVRRQVGATKRAAAQHRRQIAALNRHVSQLMRQVSLLARRMLDTPARTPESSEGKKLRFNVKGLRSNRERLGLSAAEYAKLAGVSAQTVYSWEQGRSIPRQGQLAALAGLRGIGKREAKTRLDRLTAKKTK